MPEKAVLLAQAKMNKMDWQQIIIKLYKKYYKNNHMDEVKMWQLKRSYTWQSLNEHKVWLATQRWSKLLMRDVLCWTLWQYLGTYGRQSHYQVFEEWRVYEDQSNSSKKKCRSMMHTKFDGYGYWKKTNELHFGKLSFVWEIMNAGSWYRDLKLGVEAKIAIC